jgi:hypothetical protein
VAGGNKSHSLKVKNRQLQEQAKATKAAADKRQRRTGYSSGSSAMAPSALAPAPEMTRSQLEAYSGRVRSGAPGMILGDN